MNVQRPFLIVPEAPPVSEGQAGCAAYGLFFVS